MSDFASDSKGLQTGRWDARCIDLICDINTIPAPDVTFDAILGSMVRHYGDPIDPKDFERGLINMAGLLRKDGESFIYPFPPELIELSSMHIVFLILTSLLIWPRGIRSGCLPLR